MNLSPSVYPPLSVPPAMARSLQRSAQTLASVAATATAAVPTRSRVDALHFERVPYYSMKLVISLGIASTTCGIIILLFGVVYSLIEVDSGLSSVYCEASIGVWVIVNGFITIISGSRPHSWCQLYIFMLCSLLTIGLTGALSILTANSLVNTYRSEGFQVFRSNSEIKNIDLLSSAPTVLINGLLLIFCVLAFLLAIITFYISGHSVCQCYVDHRLGESFFSKYSFDPELTTKRDRILQWIVQQSDVQSHTGTDYESISYKPKKKLAHINSTATDSTRLSAYDK